MKANFLKILLLLTMTASVSGLEELDSDSEDQYYEDGEDGMDNQDMTFCMARENVTEGEMKDFLVSKIHQDLNEPLKRAILCFLKKIDFFDGKTWKMEVIADSVGENSKMMKSIRDCLAKDDAKLESQERTYRVQKCLLETDEDSN